MRRILILGREKERYFGLAKQLANERTVVEVAEYDELGFLIDGDEATIFCQSTGRDLKEYARILVLSTSRNPERNHIFSAIACYCRKYQIEMLDDKFPNTNGKLVAMWKFWESDIRVPMTAFGPTDFLVETLPIFGGVGVLKSVRGTQGKDNYLVKTSTEIREIITLNPEIEFILQNFIPNDGDYRIVVIDFVPKLAIYRTANGSDFRNNTSLGSEATLVPLETIDSEVLELAVSAAKALEIKIAGADILQDKLTGKYYVLEVNRCPQLATGVFTDEKTAILQELVD